MSQLTPLAGSVYENFELCRSINPRAPGCNNLRRKAPVIFTVVENLFRANILLEFTTKFNLCLVESHHLLQRFSGFTGEPRCLDVRYVSRLFAKILFFFLTKIYIFFPLTNLSIQGIHLIPFQNAILL